MTNSTNIDNKPSINRDESLSHLAQRLNIVTPMLNRFMHFSCKEIGLRSPRDLCLLALLSKHSLSQAHLLKMLNVNAPTLSKQIDVLAQNGLLDRQASEEDRRSQVLSITPEGKHKLLEAAKVNERRLKEMLAEANDEQLIQILEATETLTNVITSRMENVHKSHACSWRTNDNPHHSGEKTHE